MRRKIEAEGGDVVDPKLVKKSSKLLLETTTKPESHCSIRTSDACIGRKWGLRGPIYPQNVWLQQQTPALPSATCLARPWEA